jgi:hypothetical protein
MVERFGRMLGWAWWHVCSRVPARLNAATGPLEAALEDLVPGFLAGEQAAYHRSVRRKNRQRYGW